MAYQMTHPESDQSIKVESDQVGPYLSEGWETKAGAKPPAPESK